MSSLRIVSLGPLAVSLDGVTVKLGGRQQRQVLGYLVLRANTVVTREALVSALWPDDPPRNPGTVVQVYIAHIRRLLATAESSMRDPSRSRLHTAAGGYRLTLAADELDLMQLRKLADDGRSAAERGELLTAAQALRRAWSLAAPVLFTPPAFPDLFEIEQLRPELAAVEEECLEVAQEWIDIELALGLPDVVLPQVQTLVERHPYRERFWVSLIVSLYQSERQADALQACRRVRRLFAAELGIDPGRSITELELAVLRHDASLTPVDLSETRRVRRRIDNVPTGPSELVGRVREMADVENLVMDDANRLITITGLGGMGKTRLAMAVASRHTGQGDGVCWVALATLTDAGQVPGAISTALGALERPGEDQVDTVIDFLRERQLLLVLDNFEHVIDAWSVVARLLADVPRLTILITSRRVLSIRGETEFSLQPLTLPPRDAQLVAVEASDPAALLNQLAESTAVRLLVQRGQAVRPSFRLTGNNVHTVVNLCRRLDGLPLAIELAACHLRHRSETAVLESLPVILQDMPSALLDLPARHRTLGATISWSYQLLDLAAQNCFDQLGVFVGDPTVSAVEQICARHQVPSAVSLIDSLADHNLITVRFASTGESRMTMLQPIREFSRAKLALRTDAEETHERHARCFLELAEQEGPRLMGPDQSLALGRLRDDRDDLLTAFRWSASRPETNELALRFVAALWHFWELTSDVATPCAIAEDAITAMRTSTDPLLAGRALSGLGTLHWLQGRADQGMARHRAALAAFQSAGHAGGVAWSYMCMAVQAMALEDLDKAWRLAATAQQVSHAGPRALTGASILKGLLSLYAGDPVAASLYCGEAVDLARSAGDRWMLGSALINLGEVSEQLGDFGAAERENREALKISQDLSAHILGAACLENLATVRLRQGRPADAVRLFAAADSYRREMALSASTMEKERIDSIIAKARGELGHVRFAVAWAAGRALSITQAVQEALGQTFADNWRAPMLGRGISY